MARTLIIGSPELVKGRDSANTQCKTLFADAAFPRSIRLTNHLPRTLSFPEADAYMLPLGGKAEAVINSFSALQRLVSSIEQIALLNQQEAAVTLDDVTPEPTAMPEPKPVIRQKNQPQPQAAQPIQQQAALLNEAIQSPTEPPPEAS